MCILLDSEYESYRFAAVFNERAVKSWSILCMLHCVNNTYQCDIFIKPELHTWVKVKSLMVFHYLLEN